MNRYREVYNQLCKDEIYANDILRKVGIEVYEQDRMKESIQAILVVLAERILEIEANKS